MKTAKDLKCRITETWEEEDGKEAKELVAVFDDIQDAMIAMNRISRLRPDSVFTVRQGGYKHAIKDGYTV